MFWVALVVVVMTPLSIVIGNVIVNDMENKREMEPKIQGWAEHLYTHNIDFVYFDDFGGGHDKYREPKMGIVRHSSRSLTVNELKKLITKREIVPVPMEYLNEELCDYLGESIYDHLKTWKYQKSGE